MFNRQWKTLEEVIELLAQQWKERNKKLKEQKQFHSRGERIIFIWLLYLLLIIFVVKYFYKTLVIGNMFYYPKKR